jgi:hypothetical protein
MRHCRWGLGAGAIITGAALVACGHGGSAAPRNTATPTNVLNAAYATTTGSGTAKVDLTGQVDTMVNGKPETVPVTAHGVMDFANKATDLDESISGAANDITETRYLNGMLYQRIPSQMSSFANGKHWIAIDVNQMATNQGNGLGPLLAGAPSDPSNLMIYLTAVEGQVKTVGPDTVDRVRTTHYDATIDLNKVAALDPAAAGTTKQLEQQIGSSSLPVQLWVDQQDRLRRISVDEQGGALHVMFTVTLSDYGTPVHVIAPPSNDTDDLTNK